MLETQKQIKLVDSCWLNGKDANLVGLHETVEACKKWNKNWR